jgi:integrase/recombinase XerD
MYINLNDYSITEITDTDIVVRDESLNEEAVRMFFIAKNIQGCTKKTIGYYGLTIKAFLEFMGNKPVNQITTNDIRYYLAVKKERDGNKDTNINNIRRVLSSFFGWLLEEEYIQKNPMAKIKTIKVEKRLKKPFKDEEIEKMRFAAKDNLRLSAILEVLLSTGCRVAEVEGMNREDLEGNEIVVYGKGKKERTVYLNAKCKMALERYLKSRQDDNPAMFVTQDKPHGRLKISGIEISIRNLGKSVGVKDTHPHRFRRTAATTALNRGMPIEQVQLMLGHENIETTTLYAISDVEQVKANHKKYMA